MQPACVAAQSDVRSTRKRSNLVIGRTSREHIQLNARCAELTNGRKIQTLKTHEIEDIRGQHH